MRKLGREIRFSVNPFLETDEQGANSFCSKPAGEGLAVFLVLGVAVVGRAQHRSGFVVNVLDIDEAVRTHAVPIFAAAIRDAFRGSKHVRYGQLKELLVRCQEALAGKFGQALVADIYLKLNPNRKLAIDCEANEMVYFSEKFEFAAMHKLWNSQLSEADNFELFGKCANPAGHGHNYMLEVTVKGAADDIRTGQLEQVVDRELLELIDHKNLNEDVEGLAGKNPTVERIAEFAWGRLVSKFGRMQLHAVTVWETDKTYCSYFG